MIVDVESLVKKYDGHAALDGLSFTVEEGDLFGFLGPNGAGKTTTIRILTAILLADSGTARIGGQDIVGAPFRLRQIINALPESKGYYEWMTAREYLSFFARLYDTTAPKDAVGDLLSRVGLGGKESHLIRTFSRGMKQRLGIARALINRPRVLFLDEPTNGLDPMGRRDIHDLLIGLNHDRGMTIFLSTHLLDDVERLCRNIAIIHRGRIVRAGSLAEVKGQETLEEAFFRATEEGTP